MVKVNPPTNPLLLVVPVQPAPPTPSFVAAPPAANPKPTTKPAKPPTPALSPPKAAPSKPAKPAALSFIQRNPRKLAGGGIAGVVISVVLFAASPLLAEFKLHTFMEAMERHGFRHMTHNYIARQRLILKYALKEELDPTFDIHSSIVNYDRSMMKNLIGSKIFGDDRIRRKLEEAGFQITTKTDLNNLRNRITTIRYKGHELNQGNFEVEYHYMFEPSTTEEHVQKASVARDMALVAEDALGGKGIMKRWNSRRLQILTGTKLHWIDRIALPFREAQIIMRNAVVKWIVTKSGAFSDAFANLFSLIFETKFDASTGQQILDTAATDIAGKTTEMTSVEVTKSFSKAFIDVLGKVGFNASNPINWAALIITVECKLNALDSKFYDSLSQIGKDKANAEYMVEFIAMNSALSQLHSSTNGTDSNTVGAFMELLTNSAGQDFTATNNWQRAIGKTVPYTPNLDCSKDIELCNDKRPQTIIDNNAIGRALERAKTDKESSPEEVQFFERYITFLGPRGIATGPMCSLISKATNLIGDAILGYFNFYYDHFYPQAGKDIRKELESQGVEWIVQHLFMPVVGWFFPPVVSSDTRGPALTNAVDVGSAASASMIMRQYCGDPTSGDPEAAKQCRVEGPELVASENAVNQEQIAEAQTQPLWYRLAALNNPQSLLTRLLMSTPNNGQQVINRVAAIPKLFFMPNLLHAIASAPATLSHPSFAAETYVDPLGVDWYFYTDSCTTNTKLGDDKAAGCKGMDKWDDTVACTTLSGLNRGQDMPQGCTDLIEEGLSSPTSEATPASPTASTASLHAGPLASNPKPPATLSWATGN